MPDVTLNVKVNKQKAAQEAKDFAREIASALGQVIAATTKATKASQSEADQAYKLSRIKTEEARQTTLAAEAIRKEAAAREANARAQKAEILAEEAEIRLSKQRPRTPEQILSSENRSQRRQEDFQYRKDIVNSRNFPRDQAEGIVRETQRERRSQLTARISDPEIDIRERQKYVNELGRLNQQILTSETKLREGVEKEQKQRILSEDRIAEHEVRTGQKTLSSLRSYYQDRLKTEEEGTVQHERLAKKMMAIDKQIEAEDARVARDRAQKPYQQAMQMTRIGTGMRDAGQGLTYAYTLPAVAVASAAVMSSVNREAQFGEVSKLMEGTDKDINKVKDDLVALTHELPKTFSELAKIAELGVQLGISTKDMSEFVKITAELGMTTDATSEEAATGLAKIAAVMGTTKEQYKGVASAFVEMSRNGAATAREILNTSLRWAVVGKNLNLTEADVFALSNAIASMGQRAQAGGSAILTTFQKMGLAVARGGADLENYARVSAMTSQQFADLFHKNGLDALEALLHGLDNLQKKNRDLGKTLDDLGVKNKNELLMMQNSTKGMDVIALRRDQANKAQREANLITEATGKVVSRTDSQFQIFKNDVENLSVSLGNDLVPSLKEMLKNAEPTINMIKSWVEGFAKLDPAVQQEIIRILAFTALAGPFLMFTGSVVNGLANMKRAYTALQEIKASAFFTDQIWPLKNVATALETDAGGFRILTTEAEAASTKVGALSGALTGLGKLGVVALTIAVGVEIGSAIGNFIAGKIDADNVKDQNNRSVIDKDKYTKSQLEDWQKTLLGYQKDRSNYSDRSVGDIVGELEIRTKRATYAPREDEIAASLKKVQDLLNKINLESNVSGPDNRPDALKRLDPTTQVNKALTASGDKIAQAAENANKRGYNSLAQFVEGCQKLVRETVQSQGMHTFDKYFAATAKDTMKNFVRAGVGFPYKAGETQLQPGDLLYGPGSSRGLGHAMIYGPHGEIFDQTSKRDFSNKGYQQVSWVVRPGDYSGKGGGTGKPYTGSLPGIGDLGDGMDSLDPFTREEIKAKKKAEAKAAADALKLEQSEKDSQAIIEEYRAKAFDQDIRAAKKRFENETENLAVIQKNEAALKDLYYKFAKAKMDAADKEYMAAKDVSEPAARARAIGKKNTALEEYNADMESVKVMRDSVDAARLQEQIKFVEQGRKSVELELKKAKTLEEQYYYEEQIAIIDKTIDDLKKDGNAQTNYDSRMAEISQERAKNNLEIAREQFEITKQNQQIILEYGKTIEDRDKARLAIFNAEFDAATKQRALDESDPRSKVNAAERERAAVTAATDRKRKGDRDDRMQGYQEDLNFNKLLMESTDDFTKKREYLNKIHEDEIKLNKENISDTEKQLQQLRQVIELHNFNREEQVKKAQDASGKAIQSGDIIDVSRSIGAFNELRTQGNDKDREEGLKLFVGAINDYVNRKILDPQAAIAALEIANKDSAEKLDQKSVDELRAGALEITKIIIEGIVSDVKTSVPKKQQDAAIVKRLKDLKNNPAFKDLGTIGEIDNATSEFTPAPKDKYAGIKGTVARFHEELTRGMEEVGTKFLDGLLGGKHSKKKMKEFWNDLAELGRHSFSDLVSGTITQGIKSVMGDVGKSLTKLFSGVHADFVQLGVMALGITGILGGLGKKKQSHSIFGAIIGGIAGSLLGGVGAVKGAEFGAGAGALFDNPTLDRHAKQTGYNVAKSGWDFGKFVGRGTAEAMVQKASAMMGMQGNQSANNPAFLSAAVAGWNFHAKNNIQLSQRSQVAIDNLNRTMSVNPSGHPALMQVIDRLSDAVGSIKGGVNVNATFGDVHKDVDLDNASIRIGRSVERLAMK